ncbi:MAG: hypothetical protein WAR22_14185 [Desulfomonilia bacterium]|jgi:hypothetical protein
MVNIHLCQPDASKSCAACCGIYNYVQNTRESLVQRFRYRSALMAKVRDGRLSLDDYRDIVRRREDGRRIFKTIYSCEFVGFIGGAEKRVGCMLHPMTTGGCDLRENSFYGREICDGHFCPSYQKLDPNEVLCVLSTIDDWYLYGTVITDIDFVKTFFRLVQNALGVEIPPEAIETSPELRRLLGEYFSLKLTWPFRDTSRPRFGKYYFVGEEYAIDRIDYDALGLEPGPYDPVFLSLSSRFSSKDELDRATRTIDNLFKGFCHAYERLHREHH